jgi:hypothetical protein
MRFSVLATAALCLGAVSLTAQEGPTPEHERLDVWLGEWTYQVGDVGGSMVGELYNNGLLLEVHEQHQPASGGTWYIMHVMGYNADEEAYFWHRYMPDGTVRIAKGWVDGDDWTFLFDERNGVRTRLTQTEEPGAISFTWARSVQGGAWEVTSQGRADRKQ